MKIQRYRGTGELVHHVVTGDFRDSAALFERDGLIQSGQGLPRPHLIAFSPPYAFRPSPFKEDDILAPCEFDELMAGILDTSIPILRPDGVIAINFDDWVTRERGLPSIVSYGDGFHENLTKNKFSRIAKMTWDKGQLRRMIMMRTGHNRQLPKTSRFQINNTEHIWAYQREMRDDIPERDDELMQCDL
jgi:hypothetical protein